MSQHGVWLDQMSWKAFAMNVSTAKLLSLVLLNLAAGATAVLLSQSASELDGSLQLVASKADREPSVEILALRPLAKCCIAHDVIEGRFSLLEAAALFGALNRIPPHAPNPSLLDLHPSPLSLPARTDEERLCRHVVEYVGWELGKEPDRAAVAVRRLEAEFTDELCRNGFIQLPDPASLVPVQKLLDEAKVELTATAVRSRSG